MTAKYTKQRIGQHQAKKLKSLGLDEWSDLLWCNGNFVRGIQQISQPYSNINSSNRNSELPEGCYTANTLMEVSIWLMFNKGIIFKGAGRGVWENPTKISIRIELLTSNEFIIWKGSSRSVYPLHTLLNKALQYLTIDKQFSRIK